jgi:hypothetical protein
VRLTWNGCLRAALFALIPATVTACGAGTTAPPPPPPGPNSSLTNLVSSETFPTISAVMAADLNSSGVSSNVTTNLTALSTTSTIEYDAVANAFKLTMKNGAANFTQEFTSSNVSTANSNSSYRTYQFTRSDNTIDEFVLFIPGEPTENLSYVTYGTWNSAHGSSNNLTMGTFVFGVQTATSTIPTTGTANYTGITAGTLNQGNSLFSVAGDMSMAVNFASGAVTGAFSNMGREDLQLGTVSAWRDFTTSGTINSTTGLFSGTAVTNDSALTGTFNGAFFGPVSNGSPPEIGGGWSLSGPGNESAVGAFVGKR